jgi:hypothetical protein
MEQPAWPHKMFWNNFTFLINIICLPILICDLFTSYIIASFIRNISSIFVPGRRFSSENKQKFAFIRTICPNCQNLLCVTTLHRIFQLFKNKWNLWNLAQTQNGMVSISLILEETSKISIKFKDISSDVDLWTN